MFDPAEHPHRRRNLLTGQWVLVSPHRTKRPWQGDSEAPARTEGVAHDPECYLCAGNLRSNGERNPDYRGAFVFDNDFPALLADTPAPPADTGVFQSGAASGTCQVICYSPDHSRTLPEMDLSQIRSVIDCWAEQSAQLGARHANVQIFENKGAMMGCSNPHPHGQVWASDFVPSEVLEEEQQQTAWLAERGSVLLDEVAAAEITAGERVVDLNEHWLAVVPWWASWPFEVLLIARGPMNRIEALEHDARDALAQILQSVTRRFDALFGVSFPYSMGWHQAPGNSLHGDAWRLHAHFYPPLLRSASVRKFMVGFEMFGESQRDITPEAAARQLRSAENDR